MIILNSSVEDNVPSSTSRTLLPSRNSCEFSFTKKIIPVHININLSRRTKWQPPSAVTCTVKARIKCRLGSVHKFGQDITNY